MPAVSDVAALRTVRFIIVGVLAAALQFLLTWGFMYLGWQPALAVAAAFAVAFVAAYSAHHGWTFQREARPDTGHGRTLPRYAVTQLLSLMAGAGVAEFCSSQAGMSHVVTAALSTLTSGGLSYVLSSRWVFSGT